MKFKKEKNVAPPSSPSSPDMHNDIVPVPKTVAKKKASTVKCVIPAPSSTVVCSSAPRCTGYPSEHGYGTRKKQTRNKVIIPV